MSPPNEHFALDWIRADLLQTLEDARASLEAYADGGDATRMRMCLTGLHQLHGTLLMLELDGVTCLADHLEQLAQSLTTDAIDDSGSAQQCLMQGILELPGYLDDLHRGGRDSRLPMLPLVNQARSLLGLDPLEMPGGSSVNVHAEAPASSLEKFGEIDGPGKVKRIRAAYQQVLLSILRGEDRPKAVSTLQKVAGSLEKVCADTPLASLWQAFGLFADSLEAAPDHLDNDAVKLLRRVDAEIRGLAADGVELLRRPVPVDLVRALLLAARDRDHHSELADGLEEAIEAQPGIESLRLSGQEAMSSAAVALREEIAQIRDALDLFVRSEDQDPSGLLEITAPLKQISSTLSLLGFESSRAVVIEQLDLVATDPSDGQADPEHLQQLANALVQVDSNLAVYAEGSASDEDVSQVVADAHKRVLTESRTGLDSVKQQLVAFVSGQFDRSVLVDVPGQLAALQSALMMLSLARPADQLSSCAAYVQEQLLGEAEPKWEDLDRFADAVSGVDYYLERLGDGGRSGHDGILDRVDASLTELGYQGRAFDPATAVPAVEDAVESVGVAPVADVDPAVDPAAADIEPQEPLDDSFSAETVQPSQSQALEAAADLEIDQIDASELDLSESDVDADLLIELDDESDLAEFDLDQLADGLAAESSEPTDQDVLEQPPTAFAPEPEPEPEPELSETSFSEPFDSELAAEPAGAETTQDDPVAAPQASEQHPSDDPVDSGFDLADGLELTEITAEELSPPEALLPEDDLTLHEQTSPSDLAESDTDLSSDLDDDWALRSSGPEGLPEVPSFIDPGIAPDDDAADEIQAGAGDLSKQASDPSHVDDGADDDEFGDELAAIAGGVALGAAAVALSGADTDSPDAASSPAETTPDAIQTAAEAPADDRDDEIIEIFAEEVDEVLEAIAEALPSWRANPDGDDALTEIRRSFHTLKGSGRIVGANELGEAAWAVENLLNRRLDRTIEHSAELCAVVELACGLIKGATEAFVDNRPADANALQLLIEDADVLASGGSLGGESASDDEVVGVRPDEDRLGDDETVRELFVAEAEELVGVLESAAVADDLRLDAAFMRAAHTLNGSAAAAEERPISELAGALEDFVEVASKRPNPVVTGDAQFIVRDAVFALRRQLSDLVDDREPETVDEVIAQLRTLTETSHGSDRTTVGAALLDSNDADALLAYEDHIEAWRWGDLDESVSARLVQALDALAQRATEREQNDIATSARALSGAHRAIGEDALTEDLLEAFRASHETLLSQIDCFTIGQPVMASDQQLAELNALVSEAAASSGSPVPTDADQLETQNESIDAPELEAGAFEPDLPETSVEPAFTVDAEQLSDESEDFDLADLIDDSDLDAAMTASDSASPAGDTAAEASSLDAADEQPLPQVAPGEPAQGGEEPVADLAEVDIELVDVFFEEADEILEGFDASLQDWLNERDNGVHLENLLRGLHTLKGGARLAGLMRLGDETHALESFLIDSQTNGADYDQAFFAELQSKHENLLGLLADIRRHLANAQQTPVPQAASATSSPSVSSADSDESTQGSTELATVAAPVEPVRPAAPVEMVRVSSGLLEDLVNLAGESSIMRARIEQSISDFGGALDEMETTIDRVREQLRRLEIETEAQVHYRSESQGPAYTDFDPLEMDRYNQLQELTRSLSESASDMLDLKETLQVRTREAETLLLQQGRLNTELQEGLMRTRMVPFSRLLPRLRRIVRQIGRELDKQVEFHAYNAEGELDRTVLERMVPPLEHMLRNAVDHGIESAELRRGYSKPDIGRIELRLSREGGDVVIEISDDGAGIDVESVRAKATERGLMSADAELSDEEILEFVLAPGFTTAKSVTQISGRGVGMDVVHSEVKQLGGSIEISSQPGKGTRFTVRLPFTVSVNRALMVSVADDLYAIPLNTIEGIVLLSEDELAAAQSDAGGFFEYAGVPYRVRYLGNYIGRDYGGRSESASVPVVLVRSGDHAVAVHVDAVQGSREIVVKSLGPQFAGVGGISGATILGDGNVVVILDLVALIRTHGIEGSRARHRPRASRAEVRTVMVVDDSVTVRKVTSRLLERQGMEVVVAKDGVEAIALLQEQRPDIMLLDIEMPRMDGFEVARQIRHDERLSRLPIVMITSRTGQKHQQHAREVGVDQFLGKPFQEAELLATIDELVH